MIASVTVVTADLDAAVSAYRDGVGLEPGSEQRTSGAPLPGLDGRRSVVLSGTGTGGVVHVVELPGARTPEPLTTLGWAAAEILVADADEATERARAAGLRVLAEPRPVGAGGGLRAVQVAGPAGEALYLTQVDRAPAGFILPRPRGPVGPVFIAVLAAGDLETARGALEARLPTRRVTDHPLPVRALNAQLGRPAGTLHRISTLQLPDRCAVEVDQYPVDDPAVRARRSPHDGGIVAVTLRGDGPGKTWTVPGAGGALMACA
ncbi:VOC family protein [Actinomadura sp. KC06]|uniref:VOC family protein n=1 Tax=Actinomadura sp. KC06 TaxID=2530369 RepID=UPI00104AFBDF|nr:VOC family protein [Actinomadura sp. KC06]TDD35636.1 VOC family protein [Actinomadura sp. KC06]